MPKRATTVFIFLFLLIIFFSASIYHAESEPNNTYQQANTIAPNGSDSGSLNEGIPQSSYDPDDYYKVTLTSDGCWYVTTTSSSALEIDLYIYDINGATQIASGVRYGTFESVYRVDLKAGTYYVRVYRASGTGTYSLTSRFTTASYTNDSETNDTYQTALSLGLNLQTTGHIRYYSNGSTDWDDYYKVVIPADGSLTIDTQSDSADIDVYLIDVNGSTQIRSGSAYGLTEHVQYPNLSPGTYFIRLYAAGNHQGSYSITTIYVQTSFNGNITNDSEKNDTYSTAVTYFNFSSTGSSSNYGHLGFYTNSYTDYYDYWAVETSVDGKLVVKTESNSTLDIDQYLYDVNGATVIRSAAAYGVNETLTFENLSPGKYYLRAYTGSGYGSYKITCEFTAPSLNNDAGSNDSFSTAILINVETKMTGHLGYYSNSVTDYDDFYKFSIPSEWDSLYVRADSESPLDVDLYLYNSSQVNINSGYAYGTKEVVKRGSSSAGTYYIRAYRTSGQGGYAFKISNRYMANPLTDVNESNIDLPSSYSLSQNYPNPFNPATKIRYALPASSFVELKIFDILGNEITTLVKGEQTAGYHETEFNSGNLSSGIYFYRMQAGDYSISKKMILMK